MAEMTEILCLINTISRQAASIQSHIGKISAMSAEALDNHDAALMAMDLGAAVEELKSVQEMAAYLSRPVVETGRLWKNGSGQYETTKGYCFCEGSDIEVLVPNENRMDDFYWVRTRLQYDGKNYYLAGYPGLPLKGLPVRVRIGDKP